MDDSLHHNCFRQFSLLEVYLIYMTSRFPPEVVTNVFFFFFTASRQALGPTQPPIQWVSEALTSGVKQLGREVDHSPPYTAEVKTAWSYTSTPPYIFMAWYLIKRWILHDDVVLS
jgi:hypothetical protein